MTEFLILLTAAVLGGIAIAAGLSVIIWSSENKKRAGVAILASCIPATGNAECRRFYSHCYPVHRPVVAVVEKKVIVADVVPVLAYSPPVYSVGHNVGYGAGYNDVGTQTQIRLVQLELELAKYRAGVGQVAAVAGQSQPYQQVPQTPQAGQQPAATPSPGSGATPPQQANGQPNGNGGGLAVGLQVAKNRCAVCHEAAVAVNKGKGFVMFQDGQFVAGERRYEILGHIVSGNMPRKDGNPTQRDPLPQNELDDLGRFLVSGK